MGSAISNHSNVNPLATMKTVNNFNPMETGRGDNMILRDSYMNNKVKIFDEDEEDDMADVGHENPDLVGVPSEDSSQHHDLTPVEQIELQR